MVEGSGKDCLVIWLQYQRNSELIALARIYEAHEIYAAYRSHPRS